MKDIDEMLTVLCGDPQCSALVTPADFEGRVMEGLARRREAMVSRRSLAIAGCVAICVGAASALPPFWMAPARGAATEPLLGVPAMAPSHLLAD